MSPTTRPVSPTTPGQPGPKHDGHTSSSERHGRGRGRGRPRDPASDEAILDAALALLERDGYDKMTVAGVAAEAGVTKPTVYLRYASKDDLVTAALARLRVTGWPEATGDLRVDLAAQLHHLRVAAVGGMPIIGSCLVEEQRRPELLDLIRDRTLLPRRYQMRRTLAEAQQRGEVRRDVDLDLAVSALIGVFYAHYLAGLELPEDWDSHAVDAVLVGILVGPES